jgi:hypothetical protein
LHTIDEDGPAGAHGVGRNCAVLRKQAQADEALDQLAVSLFSDKLVARLAPPEINAGDLKELAAGAAKKLDQRGGIGTFRSLGSELHEELLKRILRIGCVEVGRGVAV